MLEWWDWRRIAVDLVGKLAACVGENAKIGTNQAPRRLARDGMTVRRLYWIGHSCYSDTRRKDNSYFACGEFHNRRHERSGRWESVVPWTLVNVSYPCRTKPSIKSNWFLFASTPRSFCTSLSPTLKACSPAALPPCLCAAVMLTVDGTSHTIAAAAPFINKTSITHTHTAAPCHPLRWLQKTLPACDRECGRIRGCSSQSLSVYLVLSVSAIFLQHASVRLHLPPQLTHTFQIPCQDSSSTPVCEL
jgi:hypothetical protein